MRTTCENRQDVFTRITSAIVAELEKGTRPWTRPWRAEHAAGRITRPLRHNGQPYAGINVLSLWASASIQGFAAPLWMTYRQAVALGGHVRRGEKGSPVVYANALIHTQTDAGTGDEVERAIHFLKAYTVFNVEQIARQLVTTECAASTTFAAADLIVAAHGRTALADPGLARIQWRLDRSDIRQIPCRTILRFSLKIVSGSR